MWQAFTARKRRRAKKVVAVVRTDQPPPRSIVMKPTKEALWSRKQLVVKTVYDDEGTCDRLYACGGLEFGKGDMDGAFRLEVKKIELLDEERAGAL